ncbi:MAG TPA: hypothetical protein VG125_01805, partial [Pirellulales bacterium]|nr:hypothetical protein [Pirellulales bacterium]
LARHLVHHPHEADGVEKRDIAALVCSESRQQRQNQFIIARGSAIVCQSLPFSAILCHPYLYGPSITSGVDHADLSGA